MRALQIVELEGPGSLKLTDVPEPEPVHMLSPDGAVIVDVEAAGVSFPEVLQSRGEYQIKPPLPFVPGSEVAGTVRSAPEGAAASAGDRVAAFCALGGFAEVAVAPDRSSPSRCPTRSTSPRARGSSSTTTPLTSR